MPIFIEVAPEYKGVRTFPNDSVISNWQIFTDSLPSIEKVRAQVQDTDRTRLVEPTSFFKPTLRYIDGRRGYVIGVTIHVLDTGVRLSDESAPISLFVAREHLEKDGLAAIIRSDDREFVAKLHAPSKPVLAGQTKPYGF